jgi:glycosyltransferase involved in cell wall biosynthesis
MTPGTPVGIAGGTLRVLFLATYFPKPGNQTMGTWALDQALALKRQPIELRLVSFTSWVPRLLARSRGARAYAECPPEFAWEGLRVEYPRWIAYPVDPITRLTYRHPALQMVPAWCSARSYLRRVIQEWRPHVIYAHHSLTNGSLARHCRLEFGTPYVVTDHDIGEIADCERFPARWKSMASVARDAFAMLSVSARMEREMQRQFPFARTRTVYNGTNPLPPEVLVPRPAEFEGCTIVFSAGMFYERKGFPLLIEAFAEATRGREDVHLRVAGDGPARGEVVGSIRRFGLEHRVHLLGRIPHRQVLQEMVWSDAFALLGWNEPFGVVFAEALAAGRATVLSSDAGAAEVMQDRVHALLVPPRDLKGARDALAALIADRGLRQRLGEAGRALWSSRLTWDANAVFLVSLFREAARDGCRDA